jgi:hypothetical protein
LEVKPANSNGGLEQVTGLLKVCASVAHCWAEAAACVCLLGTIGWSQKQPKLPLEGHNRRQNLGLLLKSRNPTAFLSVEKPVLSMPKENKASQVKEQEHVGDIFWLWGLCSPGICSSRPNG